MSTIKNLLEARILVLDGAMGTMLQAYAFTEEDFRGTRFQKHHVPLIGNNDLLSLTLKQTLSHPLPLLWQIMRLRI